MALVIWVAERDVEAYISQGWECWRLTHHHGARTSSGAKTFIGIYRWDLTK